MLQFEEAVMRTDTHQPHHIWITVNEGTPSPRIVMGSGGKAEELLHMHHIHNDELPVIRRFTGGGTVLVNDRTMFVSMVGSHEFLKQFGMKCHHDETRVWNQPFPTDLMHWTAEFYRPLFPAHLRFDLLENDYVFRLDAEDENSIAKFAGNAQYMTGGLYKRFCHHTSFLWDHDHSEMEKYLTLPSRRPKYREARNHGSFLTNLSRVNWKTPENFAAQDASATTDTVQNPFLQSVLKRVYQLSETDWREHVEDVQEHFDQNQFEQVREEYMWRENKLRRNNYHYHPDPSIQNQIDLLHQD